MSRTSEITKQELALEWLLKSESPAIRYWALTDILGRTKTDPDVVSTRSKISSWAPIAEYLGEQHPAGYWADGEDVYWPKWRATVWALILLAEMGVPGTNPSIKIACEHFLSIMDKQDRSWPAPKYPDDDLRGWRSVWEPCVTGNMARTLAEFGLENDQRVREMFEWLVKYQREDGGWNCETEDFREGGEPVHHSSFMSTIEPLWAFSSLDSQKWPRRGKEAVERGVEFLLTHRLYKSDRTGKIIRPEWTELHFPLFYFYDILHGLRVVSSLGFGHDERTSDARELLRSKQLPDGTWPMEASYVRALRRNFVKDAKSGLWHSVKEEGVDLSNIYKSGGKVAEVPRIYSDLGEVGGSNPWITLNALRVLKTPKIKRNLPS
jgi:hypothetical protein